MREPRAATGSQARGWARGRRVLLLGGLFLFGAGAAQQVLAVPSFARKYGASCSTCHTAYPQLNAFGRLFRAKGYRMPGQDERFVRDPQLPLGDPLADPLWPRTILSSDLPGSSVAAFLVSTNLNAFPDRREGSVAEFDGIEEVSLILGGTVGAQWSFFGDIDLFEEGEPGEIGRLFVQWKRSLAFNVRVGLFEPRAVPLSNHRRLIRTTGYLADTLPVLAAQNFFGFSPSQKGLEAFGRFPGLGGKGEFEWAVGVVNGEHGGAAEALRGTAAGELIENLETAFGERGNFDFNRQKDIYANLDYEVWLGGSAFTFGAYLYDGTTGFLADPEDPATLVEDGNSFSRYGARFRWEQARGLADVLAAVSFGRDRPERSVLSELDTRILTAEVHLFPLPWLVPALRFEQVELDERIPMGANRFDRYTFELIFLPAANIKLSLGATRSSGDAPALPPFARRLRAGLVLAF